MKEIKAKHSNFIFRNDSKLEFKDISSEYLREYKFHNGEKLTISGPQFLHVSESGGHRLVAKRSRPNLDAICYYIHPREGWYIKWEVKKDAPHFVA